jgi:hypothetical protein
MSEHEFSLRNNHPQFLGKILIDSYDLIKGKQIQGNWGGGSYLGKNTSTTTKLYLKSIKKLDLLVRPEFKIKILMPNLINLLVDFQGDHYYV